jgi:hypothetical protein
MSQGVVSFEGNFDVGMFKQFFDESDLRARISECRPFCSLISLKAVLLQTEILTCQYQLPILST